MDVLEFGLPSGSLETATIELFRKAGWVIATSARSYRPSIDDENMRCTLVRAQEISRYVESGSLDAGITGKDWILENGSDVEVVADLVYSRASLRPNDWVLAVRDDSPVRRLEDLAGKRIATELVSFTQRYFAEHGVEVAVEFSWGATEVKASQKLVDAIVELTETGQSLQANGLRIVETLLTSNPRLIVNRDAYRNAFKREKVDQIALLLKGALDAKGRVGLKLNVPKDKIEAIIGLLPSITAPTVAGLYGTDWFAVEIVVAERDVRRLIPQLKEGGAEGIIEYPLNKIV
jgi:ATP phosphoribosyltransferase